MINYNTNLACTQGTLALFYELGDDARLKFAISAIRTKLNNVHTDGLYRCFDPYWFAHSDKADPYNVDCIFGFFAVPDWIELFVEEFNSKFKHIQLKLHHNRQRFCSKDLQVFKFMKESDVDIPVRSIAFQVLYSDNYPKVSRVYVSYLIHHLIRQLSFTEYNGRQADILQNATENFIGVAIKRSNAQGFKYRALAEYKVTEKEFIHIDNIKKAQHFEKIFVKYFIHSNHLWNWRQTEILLLFRDDVKDRIPKTGEIYMVTCLYKDIMHGRYYRLSVKQPDLSITIKFEIAANLTHHGRGYIICNDTGEKAIIYWMPRKWKSLEKTLLTDPITEESVTEIPNEESVK